MKRLFVISSLFALAASPSFAADAVVMEPASAFNWTGLYVGGHVGYGFGQTDATFSAPNTPGFAATQDYDVDGFLGGVQVGYNYQMNSLVLGVEADFSGADINGGSDEINIGVRGDTYDTKIDWFGTVRGRVGYAMDRTLIYGTGGLAFGSVENRYLDGPDNSFSEKSTKTGWTAGAGIEYALDDHWSAKAEYLYVDLGNQTIDYGGSNTEFDNKFHTVRLGLNYKF
ncbi:outer membrane protein [Mesorhizobium sp. ES1-1]|uniref:outer membrane protein n=1 Tax=Mesorhizobium sp. ES1-1 TaxID=2876629 RepID=UPI001CCED163|nr:outer membrane protein [Mesorhizobium sp. ES1-1]MBZ9676252.1 porin family protein [Mesorhizobium sp. ES1-1]